MRLLAAFLGLLLGVGAARADAAYLWPAEVKARWSAEDERGYAAFIGAIAASDCTTVDACLRGPTNPLRAGDPPDLAFSADCADLVYMLRAYYAWKRGLPFGFVTALEARDPQGEGDLRYTRAGNRALARWEVTGRGVRADIRTVFRVIRDAVSTATFRIDPRIERPLAQDFFSPAIAREALLPGSAIYNGDGHVVIVSQIDEAGRIHFLDAHPDMSVTRGVFGGQFQRGDPATGAGFHAWRPVAMADGRLAYAANDQIAAFSMEQYFGPVPAADWRAADFSEGGRNADYVEFTRRRLADGPLVYDILDEARLGFSGLCDDLRYRALAVAQADGQGVYRRPRPGRLEGVTPAEQALWFALSTPGRDRRLRNHAHRVAAGLQRLIALYAAGDGAVRYTGKSLRRDLRRLFDATARACTVRYTNSDGDQVRITFRAALSRLADLSFDPYHCPERRWGARGRELSRCDDDGVKARWYEAEAPLRGLEPASGIPANPTLDELGPAAGRAAAAPDFDAILAAAPDAPPGRRKP